MALSEVLLEANRAAASRSSSLEVASIERIRAICGMEVPSDAPLAELAAEVRALKAAGFPAGKVSGLAADALSVLQWSWGLADAYADAWELASELAEYGYSDGGVVQTPVAGDGRLAVLGSLSTHVRAAVRESQRFLSEIDRLEMMLDQPEQASSVYAPAMIQSSQLASVLMSMRLAATRLSASLSSVYVCALRAQSLT